MVTYMGCIKLRRAHEAKSADSEESSMRRVDVMNSPPCTWGSYGCLEEFFASTDTFAWFYVSRHPCLFIILINGNCRSKR